MNRIAQLRKKHGRMRGKIEERLAQFEVRGKQGGAALFEELAFCILTPQSKARSCDEAIRELKEKGLLFEGSAGKMHKVLAEKTRFHNKKTEYIVLARKRFAGENFIKLEEITFAASEQEARQALLKSVKGIGLKEAGHYLRNVGRGEGLAILDRHILKNLKRHGAISEVPSSLTPKKYLEIEGKMREFCRKNRIPMAHLDLLFWSEETGEIFK